VTVPEHPGSAEPIKIGQTFIDFRARSKLPDQAYGQFFEDTKYVLVRCALAPGATPSKGLVIGNVQSGKTMAYEGLIALARDNNVPVVIVISGTSTALLHQGVQRLEGDLKEGGHERDWWFLTNPSSANVRDVKIVQSLHAQWESPPPDPSRRRTLVVNLMKHAKHISNLVALFSMELWKSVPILIIDDEADQASLNTQARRPQNSPSRTYQTLLDLKGVFPQYTYLQYTATPQAPLLIDQFDELSPDFIHVLEPGKGYVGGAAFFQDRSPYLCGIPLSDITTQVASEDPPPQSLGHALQVFFLGLAAQLHDGLRSCRSMLIHPSRKTQLHGDYQRWAEQTQKNLRYLVDAAKDSPDGIAALVELLDNARLELLRTKPDLPSTTELLDDLKFALSNTLVMTINARAGKTPEIRWEDAQGFVLIGGQAMDRGFTVEGLTVTYMPRGVGVGNADTVEQRGRFFGYKEDYLAYCRIFLEPDARFAFEAYVEHEESLRSALRKFEQSGEPLDQWPRAFILDPSLKPTRANVIRRPGTRGDFTAGWYTETRPPVSPEATQYRSDRIRQFLNGIDFKPFSPGKTDLPPAQTHQIGRLPLADALELIKDLPAGSSASAKPKAGLEMQLSYLLHDNPAIGCAVIRMRPDYHSRRKAQKAGTWNPHQGRSPSDTGDTRYPGDAAVCVDDVPTLQIHVLTLKDNSGVTVAQDAPVLAARIPDGLVSAWYAQAVPS
jgi:hypothetical protein